MGAGLIVYNNTGNLVIDGSYRNLAVVQQAQLNLENGQQPPTGWGNYRFFSITYSGGQTPIVAVRPDAVFYRDAQQFPYNYVRARVQDLGGGNFRIDFSGRGPFTYWIYDTPQTPTENAGLAVWNGQGQLVFHSGYKYLRVVDYAVLNPGATVFDPDVSTQAYYQRAIPAGRSYAIAQNKSVVSVDIDDDLGTGMAAIAWSETVVVLTTSGNLDLVMLPADYSGYIYPAGALIYSAAQTAGAALCIDVTAF